MKRVIPYSKLENFMTYNVTNKEKLKPYSGSSVIQKSLYTSIINRFNKCECVEKDIFYGECSRVPQNSPISYMEIEDSIPTCMFTIKKIHQTYRYSTTNIDETLMAIIKSDLYSFIIREFESNKEDVNLVITCPMRINQQFIMVKILNKNVLIEEAKKNWRDIISSTILCGLRSILSHFEDMTEFYYKIVRKRRFARSVYSFIDDNKADINHILPSLETSFKSYNQCVLKYINKHLREAYMLSDYNIKFNRATVQEVCKEQGLDYYNFSTQISDAIASDVITQLKELETNFSEFNMLKKPCLKLVEGKLKIVKLKHDEEMDMDVDLGNIQLPMDADEMIEYLPGANPVEDSFYYGFPNTIEVSTEHIYTAMKKNIKTENDINNIDYISGYPFKESFKKTVFRMLKRQNDTIKVSHLFLHYFCLYIYITAVASMRSGSVPLYDNNQIERARSFSKENINSLRKKLANFKTMNIPNDQCLSFKMT
ncbi:p5 variant A [pistacia virus B]|uniref:P5 variant A n=1 Tax=pistacia virus B TaxID=2848035 RepID=A0A410JAL5_9VIRU|nr:p5 variant A [Pistacia emaravirus]QAR18006.1 p5 variant A [pistacia virus B]